jgi:large subunit ribosomal protein L9
MKSFELLLMDDVPKLGTKGSIVKVKCGYGRNYLIPRGLAGTVTKENLRKLEILKKRDIQLELAKKEDIKRLAKELEVTACNIEAKANEEGHLFGSITYPIIAEHLAKMGFHVTPENIQLVDPNLYPIKQLGIYAIQIQLHPEIVARRSL